MSTLVTLDQVKAHLRLSDSVGSPSVEDTDLQLKLDQAEEMVLDFYDRDQDWTADTVPLRIQAAILEQCAELYRFRGDDVAPDAPKHERGYPSPGIVAKVRRDPPLA